MEEIYCFAGNPLDRVSQRRQDAGWVTSLLEDPATRVLPLHGLKPPVRHSSATALDWQSVAPWRQLIDSGNTLILLGIRDGHAFFALTLRKGSTHTSFPLAITFVGGDGTKQTSLGRRRFARYIDKGSP